MLSDSNRGFLLEILLSKILFACADTVQCVCMSATLPNITDLSHWLSAALYVTTYRPVSLCVSISMRQRLYHVKEKDQKVFQPTKSSVLPKCGPANHTVCEGSPGSLQTPVMTSASTERSATRDVEYIRDIRSPIMQIQQSILTLTNCYDSSSSCNLGCLQNYNPAKDIRLFDEDGLLAMCLETMSAGKSVLVFCSSKEQCSKTAQRWSAYYSRLVDVQQQLQYSTSSLAPDSNTGRPSTHAFLPASAVYGAGGATCPSTLPGRLAPTPTVEVMNARKDVLKQLSACSVGLCSSLKQTIIYGAAHHHAG
jgi:superfamily II RNA helicase